MKCCFHGKDSSFNELGGHLTVLAHLANLTQLEHAVYVVRVAIQDLLERKAEIVHKCSKLVNQSSQNLVTLFLFVSFFLKTHVLGSTFAIERQFDPFKFVVDCLSFMFKWRGSYNFAINFSC